MSSMPPPKEELGFPWPFPQKPGWFYRWQSNATIFGVFCLSKLVFCGFNKLVVRPEEKKKLLRLLEDRSRPLVTICNHRCVVDDPLLWAMFSFREFLRNISRFRYTLAAHDICFTRGWHTWGFSRGRCVPVIRGNGVFQQGVDYCVEMLSRNGWVHIFPEGKVVNTVDRMRIKWGIGRLIAEPVTPPVLVPFWVRGMDDVWSKQWPYFPRIGKIVEVSIGEPVDTSDWLHRPDIQAESELQRRKRLADLAQAELYSLGDRVERR